MLQKTPDIVSSTRRRLLMGYVKKHPMKLLVLYIFHRRLSRKKSVVSQDIMRGWRAVEDAFYMDMARNLDAAYRPFGTTLTLDLFARLVKAPAEFRAIDNGIVANGYRVLCGVHYALPGGSMLVTFPQPGNWSRHVRAYVMGEPDREACARLLQRLAVVFIRVEARTRSND
jgi:hypothetical protein